MVLPVLGWVGGFELQAGTLHVSWRERGCRGRAVPEEAGNGKLMCKATAELSAANWRECAVTASFINRRQCGETPFPAPGLFLSRSLPNLFPPDVIRLVSSRVL